ncbi:MAG: pectate lyase [Mangrovibacterium sp.]
MIKKSLLLFSSFLSVFLMCSNLSVYAQKEEKNRESVKIDTSPFEDSVHHWYDFFADEYVIQPLPDKPRYEETEIIKIADNILLFQKSNGGWAKNYDMRAILSDEQKQKLLDTKSVLHTTFDNGTTYTQVDYLAQAYTLTHQERFKEGCLKGIDFILSAQYGNGGWPQYYPFLPGNAGYSAHITFNDGAYIGIMNTLNRILDKDPSFSFVDDARREWVKTAFSKGLDCILKTQIVENGERKVWCQQHDEVTLKPAWARTFEPPCLCSGESAPVVLFLMSIEHPDNRIIAAVQGAVKWFGESKILNTRCIDDPTAPKYISKYKVHNFDRRIVHDLNAPPIWTRYYELNTGRPIFCDRDRLIVYHISDLGRERRSGYSWYSYAPLEVLDRYSEWQKKWAKGDHILLR